MASQLSKEFFVNRKKRNILDNFWSPICFGNNYRVRLTSQDYSMVFGFLLMLDERDDRPINLDAALCFFWEKLTVSQKLNFRDLNKVKDNYSDNLAVFFLLSTESSYNGRMKALQSDFYLFSRRYFNRRWSSYFLRAANLLVVSESNAKVMLTRYELVSRHFNKIHFHPTCQLFYRNVYDKLLHIIRANEIDLSSLMLSIQKMFSSK